jgi:hypothetical protein
MVGVTGVTGQRFSKEKLDEGKRSVPGEEFICE